MKNPFAWSPGPSEPEAHIPWEKCTFHSEGNGISPEYAVKLGELNDELEEENAKLLREIKELQRENTHLRAENKLLRHENTVLALTRMNLTS